MGDRCLREPDAFLFAVGELGFWESLGVAWHLVLCRSCRTEARRLRGTSKQIGGALGASVATLPLRVWAVKGAWLAMIAIGSMGLYVAGQRAVEAAMSTLDRPQIRQATFSEDEPRKRR
jgi:hypothetical protein